MSDTLTFEEILNTKAGDIEAAPKAPIGTYMCQVVGAADRRQIDKRDGTGTWDIIEFPMQGVSATDEVDPDDLEEFGGAERLRFRHSFMFDTKSPQDCADTLDRMKRFITQHLEADVDESTSVAEMMAAAEHCQCLVTIDMQKRKGTEGEDAIFDLRVKKTAAVD